ncbi:amino acid ABC transporter permease [Inquilinus sp. Marseille-Q2685]|uniref:amino acid ABC transporter permease n=1 Tax=Inquilinus sp. Marseille-Q2685 TaxID=2866581 RepID=UPI001CE40B2D|nr:amino acid ABC transporter permease [Inquilinus sp. Marseille-Q2685]
MIRLFEALAQPLLLRGLLFLLSVAALAGFDYGGLVARLAEVVPVLALPAGQAAGPWLVIAVLAALVVLNFWLLSHLPFRAQVAIIWLELLALFAAFCWSFGLSYSFMADRAPILLGLELRDGFIQGAALTLFICAVSIAISTVIALAAALARLSDSGPAFGIATFYISFFRGTPLLLQTMLIYLGLPQLGLVIDAIPAGIIALSLCYGAYMAEIFRAGILAIPRGQSEAALSLGLKPAEVTWLVVLPQAMRLIIPPTGNQFIAMLKDSSLVSVMGVWEIMFLARTHGRAEFKYMEMLIVAALIYWAMSAVFELVQARIEKRFGKGVSAR